MWKSVFSVCCFPLLASLSTSAAIAQSIIAAPDGTGTLITIDGQTYHIQGGTEAGANLFHSFQQFGLSNGEIANFFSNPSITNIFGRVVGGDPSFINGLIQATPNLYLMNPAGIVFGAGASLNVGGDFTATTADRIGFDGGWFNAAGDNHYATLIGAPNQFAFLSETPSAVINAGTLTSEHGITLLGGTVVQGGAIAAPTITLAAVPGTRLVNVAQDGMLLSLDLPQEVLAAGISPTDLPRLLTVGGMELHDSVVTGDVHLAGQAIAEQADFLAAGRVTVTGPDVVTGEARVVRFSETGDNPDQAVFIDARADNPEALLFGAEAGTVAQIIRRDKNGIATITEQLSLISDSVGELKSVAIVAEGNQGNFWLGNQWVRSDSLGDYAAQLQAWGDALSEDAALLLYSCFTALGAMGEAFVQSLANLTGVTVAASTNVTGSANYGGDWNLEYQTGNLEIVNPFTVETLRDWDGKLAVLTVTSSLDDGSGGTLREQIGAALAGDTVIFDMARTVTLGGTEIAWATDNLTIDGNGSTVSGNNDSRVFHITADVSTTFQNITITGGNTTGRGGGILSSGALTLTNATVLGNSSSMSGGGISSVGNVTLNSSSVSSNSSFNGGGGISTDVGSVILNSSSISGNSVSSGSGGIYTSAGSITLNSSSVSGNFSSGFLGGGISSRTTINLNSSSVSGNSSNGSGGGIWSRGNVTITSSSISGNSSGGSGGGVFNYLGNVTITSSSVSGNFSNGSGGGIASYGNVTITSSSISGNSSGANGSEIYAGQPFLPNSGSGTVTITDHIGDLNLDIRVRNAVNLSGQSSITVTGDIQTNGNPLTINAATTLDTTALTLNTSSNTGGGDITLTAGGNLTTRNLITAALTSGNGGNVTLTSTNGSINTLSGGGTGSINTTSASGNSGTVTMNAPQGIVVGSINTEAVNGAGGAVTLESGGFVQIQGALAAADSAFNSFAASISSGGSSTGGAILIRHGGNGVTPFIVGNASTNGTQAALTAGTGLTIQPTQAYFPSHTQPGISILTNIIPDTPTPLPGNSSVNLAISPEIASAVSGSAPKNQNLDIEEFIRRIGRQAGGETFFDSEGNYTWSLPGEAALGGSLEDNIILQELVKLDEFITHDFQLLLSSSNNFGDVANTTEVEDSGKDDEETSIANIRETFKRIREQTRTNPALVYVLSQPDFLELILITPDDQLTRTVVPVSAERVQKSLTEFRRGILNVRRQTAYQEPAQQLHEWLIAPLTADLDALAVDTLIFAMGEGLRHLPLAALHDGQQFLIEKYSLGQIPSLSLTNSNYRSLHDARLLMMGASEFEALSPLPGVAQEAAVLSQILSSSTYLNEDFTYQNLAAQSRNRAFEIVHLATHADFNAGQLDDSYIQLWGNEQIVPHLLRTLRWYENPQVELLVLSACETALGDVNAELGFAGLAVQAGVKSALASLWQVSDAGTLALMGEFYRHLINPEITIKAQALRQAQLTLLQRNQFTGMIANQELEGIQQADFSHPFYWSAFMMVGSPW